MALRVDRPHVIHAYLAHTALGLVQQVVVCVALVDWAVRLTLWVDFAEVFVATCAVRALVGLDEVIRAVAFVDSAPFVTDAALVQATTLFVHALTAGTTIRVARVQVGPRVAAGFVALCIPERARLFALVVNLTVLVVALFALFALSFVEIGKVVAHPDRAGHPFKVRRVRSVLTLLFTGKATVLVGQLALRMELADIVDATRALGALLVRLEHGASCMHVIADCHGASRDASGRDLSVHLVALLAV
jgi:hypothetical protein